MRHDDVMQLSDGTRLHVEVDGPDDAPVTVIFSHGIAMNTATWDDQREAMAATGARLVYYDHRDFGRSEPWSGGEVTIRQLAEDLAELLEWAAPTGPVVLVGHSMGTLTIQALAEIRPDLFGTRVEKVVLAAAPGHHSFVTLGMPWGAHRVVHRAAPAVMACLPLATRVSPVARLAFASISWWAHGAGTPLALRALMADHVAANDPRALGAYVAAVLGFEADGAYEALGRVDTVLVHGTRDRLVSLEGARRLAGLVQGADLVEYPGIGHMVQNEAAPGVNALLAGVLAPYLTASTAS